MKMENSPTFGARAEDRRFPGHAQGIGFGLGPGAPVQEEEAGAQDRRVVRPPEFRLQGLKAKSRGMAPPKSQEKLSPRAGKVGFIRRVQHQVIQEHRLGIQKLECQGDVAHTNGFAEDLQRDPDRLGGVSRNWLRVQNAEVLLHLGTRVKGGVGAGPSFQRTPDQDAPGKEEPHRRPCHPRERRAVHPSRPR